jgi:hypothetical protein
MAVDALPLADESKRASEGRSCLQMIFHMGHRSEIALLRLDVPAHDSVNWLKKNQSLSVNHVCVCTYIFKIP